MSCTQPVFDVRMTADSILFYFSSTMENIDDVCAHTTAWLKSKTGGFEKELFSINLVTRESLTNAVRHGNKGSPKKMVRFKVTLVNNKSIRLTIEDEGEGFDWKKQQDTGFSEDDEHGRGIIIMETYFSRYSYNDKGNKLTIEKDLSCGG